MTVRCLCPVSTGELVAAQPFPDHDTSGEFKWWPVLLGVAGLSFLFSWCCATALLLPKRFEQRFTVRRVREFCPPTSAASAPSELLMTLSAGTDGYEEADLVSSLHWGIAVRVDGSQRGVVRRCVLRTTRGLLGRRHHCASFSMRKAFTPTGACHLDPTSCSSSSKMVPLLAGAVARRSRSFSARDRPRPFPSPKTRGKAARAQSRWGRGSGAKGEAQLQPRHPASSSI